MAEAVATLQLVSAIITLIDFGGKTASRLHEFSVKSGEIPESFRAVAEQLPLLLVTLKQLEGQVQAGKVDEASAKALQPLINSTLEYTKNLQAVVTKVVPDEQSSTFRKRLQAIRSLALDKDVAENLTKLRQNIQLLVFHQSTRTAEAVDKVLDAISSLQINPPTQPSTDQGPGGAQSLASVFMVPFRRDKNFVNRDIIDEIAQQLEQPNARIGIVGLGGTGKSQIAIEHAYRTRDNDPQMAVFWIHAGSKSRMQHDFASIAERLQLPGRENRDADLVALTCRRLSAEANQKWLLIIDNADDPRIIFNESTQEAGLAPDDEQQSLAECMPVSEFGAILFTSRNLDVVRNFVEHDDDIFNLGALDTAGAANMFRQKLSKRVASPKEDEVVRLVTELQCLPLAISQAAALINQRSPRMSVTKYLEEYSKGDEDRQKLLKIEFRDARRDIGASSSVFATFHISFETIKATNPTAADLLSHICMFDRAGIPESLLLGRYLTTDDPHGDPAATFEDDLAVLLSYDLVHSQEDNEVELHGLVQLAMKSWLEYSAKTAFWQHRMIYALSEVVPEPNSRNQKEWSRLLPHVRIMEHFRQSIAEKDLLSKWVEILLNESGYMAQNSRWLDADGIALKLREAVEFLHGTKSREYLKVNMLQITTFAHRGKIKEGKDLLEETLEVSIEQLGYEDVDTIKIRLSKAASLIADGELMNAEEALQQIISSSTYAELRAELGTDAEQHLSEIYQRRMDLPKAMEYLDLALDKSKKIYGEYDPETISIMVQQSWLMMLLQQFGGAEMFLRNLLEIAQKHVGPDHPVLVGLRNNLAEALSVQGHVEEAAKIHKELLERNEQIEGPGSAQMLLSMFNYAVVCTKQGQFDVAIHWFREAIDVQTTITGPLHRETLKLKIELAKVLMLFGDDEKAIALFKEGIEGLKQQPDTPVYELMDVEGTLATLYIDSDRLQEAHPLLVSVAEKAKQLGGETAGDAAVSIGLAQLLWKECKFDEAIKKYNEGREFNLQIGGEEHPSVQNAENIWTALTKLTEAKTLLDEGQHEKAQSAFEEGLAAKIRFVQTTAPDQNAWVKRYKAEFETYKQALERSSDGQEKDDALDPSTN